MMLLIATYPVGALQIVVHRLFRPWFWEASADLRQFYNQQGHREEGIMGRTVNVSRWSSFLAVCS